MVQWKKFDKLTITQNMNAIRDFINSNNYTLISFIESRFWTTGNGIFIFYEDREE